MGAAMVLAPSLLWLAIMSAVFIGMEARPENPSPIEGSLPIPAERQDLANHPWYTYVFNDLGVITHYFVGTEVPVNSCATLSLDGGSGAASACNGWILTFAEPLLLETEPILIQPALAE